MALALDGSAPAHVAANTGASATTASFTPPSGALLVAMTTGQSPNSAHDMTVTVTGGGLTWTRRVARIANSTANSTGGVAGRNGTGAEIWTAVSAGAAMTVTADVTGNAGVQVGNRTDLQVMVLTDSSTPTIGNVNHAISASGAPTADVASTTAGSYMFGVAADWANAGVGTAQTGETMINTATDVDYSHHFVRSTSTSPGGTYTIGVSAPATQDYNFVALEVKTTAAAAASPVFPRVPHRGLVMR